MTYCVSINGVAVRTNEISDCFDVILDDNSDMVQVSKIDGAYKVTNAMNGYGVNIKNLYENAVVKVYAELEEKEKTLFDFCHFIGECGYKINGWDDSQLTTVIERFLNLQSAPSAQ